MMTNLRCLIVTLLLALSGLAQAQTLYYIHADQLNTPRLIADEAGNTVWRWDNREPFGTNAPSEYPGANGQPVRFNLRFPGQYYDAETGTFYNYFRDYDPQTGRYVQSDPIGLAGGVNTYAYVGGNPISYSDPLGLASSGGPYHPRGGVKLKCVASDTCPQLEGKMQQLKRMIDSHEGWDWNNPSPRGGGRHSEEIAALWNAYARCQAIWKKKDCDNCPPKKTFSEWVHDLFYFPAPAPDPMEELGLSDAKPRQDPGGFGGPGGAPAGRLLPP